jgi:hypothetical protein
VRRILLLAAIVGVPGIAFLLARPVSPMQQSGLHPPFLLGAHADEHVLALIEKSCQNCHSFNTEWPLYSRVFPLSVVIARDVREARSHMNLSQWDTYDNSRKRQLLSQIGSVVRNGVMPPRRYTFAHPGARLTDKEVNEIYQWSRSERALLSQEPAK